MSCYWFSQVMDYLYWSCAKTLIRNEWIYQILNKLQICITNYYISKYFIKKLIQHHTDWIRIHLCILLRPATRITNLTNWLILNLSTQNNRSSDPYLKNRLKYHPKIWRSPYTTSRVFTCSSNRFQFFFNFLTQPSSIHISLLSQNPLQKAKILGNRIFLENYRLSCFKN